MRLGVVGGGQLGRFFVLAAQDLGHTGIVLDPDEGGPAALVADRHVRGPYEDERAVAEFITACDAVTVEFENVPASCLERIAAALPLHPSPASVAVASDRREEKRRVASLGLATAPFDVLESATDLERLCAAGGVADAADGGSAVVVKTARLGYDGKGQVRIAAGAERRAALRAAWDELGRVPCTVEGLVPLDRELSIVLARAADGTSAVFPPTVNTHADGILDASVVAPDDSLSDEAREAALCIADELDHVGVLAVEFFVSGGALLVNELAPRPHNSGHWTLDGAATSQFAQQARILAGRPLGDPSPTHRGIAMVNLLGELWADGEPRWEAVDGVAGAHLHRYGKREARPGRKMGHLTVLRGDPDEALEVARTLRSALTAH